MNNPKHTRGPWKVARYDNELAVTIKNYTIALLDQSYFDKALPDNEVKANAHLIAAAPDMLEALETICDEVTDLTFEQLCLVKDAIRKARGGTNG